MATTYAYQKGKFGGPSGTIFPFFRDFIGTNPQDEEYVAYVPAGFLRCRGQILSANQFPELASIVGVGEGCIYRKEGTTLQNAVNGVGGTFQLPDLGSKFISAGSTPGQYNNLRLSSNENVYKAGIEVTLASAGNDITFTYAGNFTIPAHSANVFGNWTLQAQTTTSSVSVSDGQMLTHAHYANVAQLHYGSTPSCGFKWKYQPCWGGGWSWLNLCACNSSSEVNKQEFIGDLIAMGIELSELGSDTGTTHNHSGASPTITSQSKSANMATTTISASSIVTTVRLNTASTIKIDAVSPKFILCEYLIKY